MAARAENRFRLEHLGVLADALGTAERLAEKRFAIPRLPSASYPYHVATRAELDPAERTRNRFARLAIYERSGDRRYRICLQDDIILKRVAQDHGAVTLKNLLVYVLLHEIIHVVRFERREVRFDSKVRGRMAEEETVHQMTYDILASFRSPGIRAVLDRYSPCRPGKPLDVSTPRVLIL